MEFLAWVLIVGLALLIIYEGFSLVRSIRDRRKSKKMDADKKENEEVNE